MDGNEVREETADVGGSHGGTRDGVGRLVTAVPGREDVKTGSEDVNALAVVGEVGSVVAKRGSTDSNGFLGGSGRVVAGVFVVAVLSAQCEWWRVTADLLSSSDGKVKPSLDGSIDGVIEGLGLSTTEGHVGDRSLVLGLSGGSKFLDGGSGSGGGVLGGPPDYQLKFGRSGETELTQLQRRHRS